MGCSNSQPTSTVNSISPTENGGLHGNAPPLSVSHEKSRRVETPQPEPEDSGKTFEVDVCATSEMRDGEMREVTLKKDTKALVVKDRGAYYAIGNKCTHFGASLINGAVCNGRVRCPWHGACFRLDSGDIEEFPGLDSLPRYDIHLENGRVKVVANSSQIGVTKRMKPLRIAASDSDDVVVIVGSGAAGATAAETLRQEGYEGRLLLLSRDSSPPYDRTKLSKAMNTTIDAIRMRADHFYSVYDIELRLNTELVRLDAGARLLHFSDGDTLGYTKLLIATGLSPRKLNIPDATLPGVHYLRDLSDALRISDACQKRRVVVLGSSFIALEAAAYLTSRATSITVVMRGAAPFLASFGAEVGVGLQKFLESKGIQFIANSGIEKVEGEGQLTAVVLTDNQRLEADLLVVGIGTTTNGPPTDFIGTGQLERDEYGHICVNERMETSQKGIYAAGDVTNFPLSTFGGVRVRIGHWHMAQHQGRVAALNMLGQDKDLHSVPFFWSQMFGKSVRFAGYTAGATETVIHGDVEKLQFVAFYLRENKVVGVASMNFDPIAAQVAEMLSAQRAISRHEIADDPRGFVKRMGGGPRQQMGENGEIITSF